MDVKTKSGLPVRQLTASCLVALLMIGCSSGGSGSNPSSDDTTSPDVENSDTGSVTDQNPTEPGGGGLDAADDSDTDDDAGGGNGGDSSDSDADDDTGGGNNDDSSGGGSTDDPGNPDSGTPGDTGLITIGLTDAPVSYASEVVIEFNGITFQPADGERVDFPFDSPRQVDVLSLQRGARELLLDDISIPAGAYDWVRLDVDASNDGNFNSYIKIHDVKYQLELKRPGGLQMKVGFTLDPDERKDLTIDFDLAKSIGKGYETDEWGTVYRLSPVLRLVETNLTGTVGGTVDPGIFTGMECGDLQNGWAVYIFEGADVVPDDVDGNDPNPLKIAPITFEEDSYGYRVAYLLGGDYTLAPTCQAHLDDPEVDDLNETVQRVNFADAVTVTVEAGTEVTQDF